MRSLSSIAVIALVLAGCAHRGDPARDADRDAPSAEAPAADRAPSTAPREISTDHANAEDPGAQTAARRASQRVVEEGKGYLIAGQLGPAEDRFTHATRIDPTNGFAYFYLGRTKAETGDRAGALGMLEKADSLLGPYPVWRARVARLQAALNRS